MLRNLLNNRVLVYFLVPLFLLLNICTIGQNHNWQKLPFRLNSYPNFFYVDSLTDKLLVGGFFRKVNGIPTDLFFWNGTDVSFLNDNNFQAFPPLTAIRLMNNKLFIGGPNGLYEYIDTSWVKLDTDGNENYVSTLYSYNNQLLVGGLFSKIIGSQNTPYATLSIVNMNSWNPLFGIDTILPLGKGYVSVLIEYKNQLYAAGDIHPQEKIKEIMRWDGTRWTDVGGGIPGLDEWVNDMVIYKGDLYIAGRFYRTKGAIDNHIARWDGTSWKTVGGGVNGQIIYDLQVFNDELWVAGIFDHAGGVPADNIAKWDGTKWCGFGNKFDNALGPLGVYKNELYLGGGFRSIDGDTSISYMAKWVGGNYSDTCGAIDYTGINNNSNLNNSISIYPNPCNEILNIRYDFGNSKNQEINITIYNSVGQKLLDAKAKSLNDIFTIDISKIETGVLIIEITADDKISRQRIIKY